MKVHTFLLLMILAAITALVTLNWGAFMTPAPLSLGFASVEAPLGLVMLGLLALLTVSFLVFAVYLQGAALFDARRQARELHANRELANQAEASRFTELRHFLESELNRQASLGAEARTAVQARLDQLERDLRSTIEQSENTLAAHIGELEDRLERERGATRLSQPQ